MASDETTFSEFMQLHDLGVRAEAVVGPTAEGVLVVSKESRLVHLRTVGVAGGPAAEQIEAPTTEPVQSAAVSTDGSRVAVVDLRENVVVYDLASGDELDRTSNDRSAFVADFSDRVLYAIGDDSLRLGMEPGGVEIPIRPGTRSSARTPSR